MKISIDKESRIPVYTQIFEQIRRQILAGELTAGCRLPPERKLADSLGVNRSTVLSAYRELKAEGLATAQVGNGTVGRAASAEPADAGRILAQEPAWSQLFSQRAGEVHTHVVKDLLLLASRQDVISFATGIAAPELGPFQAFAGLERELVGNRVCKPLLHSPTEGFVSLREAICGLMRRRGVYCQPDEVLVLSGSQQGLDLLARVLVDPGDLVVVEEPTFFPATQAFRLAGARVIGVPVDGQGLRLDLLEQLLQRSRPKLIYTMPSFHNPTGAEMPLGNRPQLISLARKYGTLVLEDDAYGDLCYDGTPLPLLKSLDPDGTVVYLSTFSKNVFGGLRLGWLVAHRQVVHRCAQLKQIMDLHTSSLTQWIIERFITGGGFDAHVQAVCREYRHRRDTMLAALDRCAPAGMAWNKPRGGYYIWCRLPDGVSADRLVAAAAAKRVVFLPGSAFYTDRQGDGEIRLNFTFAAPAAIEEGIRLLGEAIREVQAAPSSPTAEEWPEIKPLV